MELFRENINTSWMSLGLYFFILVFLLLFWCFFVQHVVFLINCMPTPLFNNVTPYEKLYKKLCDISHLRVFGCLCYSSTILTHRKKLDSHVVPGVFLSFKRNTKGFLFLNLKNHKIDLSRNVFFHENCFPYHSKHVQNNDSNSLSFLFLVIILSLMMILMCNQKIMFIMFYLIILLKLTLRLNKVRMLLFLLEDQLAAEEGHPIYKTLRYPISVIMR